jgi:hypothetical protein
MPVWGNRKLLEETVKTEKDGKITECEEHKEIERKKTEVI